jgi:hypothetical protein
LTGELNTHENNNNSNLRFTKENIELRRGKVLELSAQGYSVTKIAQMLGVSHPLISLDLQCLREQAKENIRVYIDEKLPSEYEKCLVSLNTILNEAFIMSNSYTNKEDATKKIQALSLAKDCLAQRLDLLTNISVVKDAISFVEGIKNKQQHVQQREQEEKQEVQTVF